MIDLPDFDELSDNQSMRINCPDCGGRGTFTATRVDGTILYNCYKAGCSLSGKKDVMGSSKYIRSKSIISAEPTKLQFNMPDHFSIYHPNKMVSYCVRNNIDTTKVQLYYDVKLDRAVFPIFMVQPSNFDTPTIWRNKVVDAVGRTLGNSWNKWHRYGNSGLPFICGNSEICYVVEDCASAVAVSQYGTGLALLGTNLSDQLLDIVVNYPYVIVCLDRDASAKAIQMKNRIGQFTKAEVRLLDVDPKEKPEGVLE
tara:strand:+ start:1794 stop:2558 length:765 start_codon:yes stop_codon:yes gene_type:complete